MEINTIQLLVHPGYHQLLKDPNRKIGSNAESHFLLKNTFNTLGQIVLASKEKKQTLIIFVPAQDAPTLVELQKEQERFQKWAETIIGKRFIQLPSNFGVGLKLTSENLMDQFKPIKPAIDKLDKIKFGTVVKIVASGEYKEQCVTTAKERLAIALQGLGVKQIIKTNSKYVLNYEQSQKTHAKVLFRKKYTDFVKWRRQTFGKRSKTIKPQTKNRK